MTVPSSTAAAAMEGKGTTTTATSAVAAAKPKRPKSKRSSAPARTNDLPLDPQQQQPTPSKRRKSSTNTTGANKKETTSTTSAPTLPTPPLTHTLILDNGGDTIKYGWAQQQHSSTTNNNNNNASSSSSSSSPQQQPPFFMSNITARLHHQWTVLVGDEWEEYCQQHSVGPSAAVLSRAFERGIMVNLGHQVMVWKRILDVLGVSVVVVNAKNTETAQAMGWKNNKKPTSNSMVTVATAAASSCAVLLLLPPYCPRVILDQIVHVWLEDFGFSHVGVALSSVCAAQPLSLILPSTVPSSSSSSNILLSSSSSSSSTNTGCVCVVDLGWSATHIVPTYQGRLIAPSTPPSAATTTSISAITAGCIRRMPLGGRHLLNLWKYATTYRQWNLMDQEPLLRQVHHQLAYVALHLASELQVARRRPAGQRPYDREVVLPDYQTTFEGKIQLPRALQRRQLQEQEEQQQQQQQQLATANAGKGDEVNQEAKDDGDDVDHQGDDGSDEGHNNKGKGNDENEEEDDDDDNDEEEEEETLAEKRKRLLRQRQEEEERRRDQQQMLQVSVERFTIPEVLFRPSDAGLPESMAGLPQAIVQAIQACPRPYQAALYQSIHLVGAGAQLTNLTTRLQNELRCLVPTQYEVNVTASSQPMTQAWKGAQSFVHQSKVETWAWSKQEWVQSHQASKKAGSSAAGQSTSIISSSSSTRGLYARLIAKNPGMFI